MPTKPPPPHAAYLAKPEMRDAIQDVLRRRGVRAIDSEDLAHDVLERALRVSRPPQSRDECLSLVRKMAKDMAIDSFKLRRGRAKYNAGPYENPDEAPAHAPTPGEERHPIDAARQLDVVGQQIASGTITARQASILASNALDIPHAEIAAQMNLAPQTVRNELGAARRTARASWASYLATSLLAVVGLVIWQMTRAPEPVSAPSPYPPPPEVDAGSDASMHEELSPAQRYRREAAEFCGHGRSRDCLDDLDIAAGLDPAGDSAPDVQHMRETATRILRELNK